MRYWAIIKIAFRALRRNKMRTILTMLGIIIGVGAVIAMVALGRAAKEQIQARIAALGQNVVVVFSGSVNRNGVFSGFGGAGTLTVEDALAIQNEVPNIAAVSPEVRTSAQIMAGENNWSTSIMGESVDYLPVIRQWDFAEGDTFTEADVRAAAKVCILGKTTADKLFPDGGAVGQIIRIKNVPVKVVGVLTPKGVSMVGQDQDDTVIVPYTTGMKRFAGQTMLRVINVSATTSDHVADVIDGITQLLRQRHRIQAGRDDDFIIRNPQEFFAAQNATTDTMTALLAGVATISLIVGGIGIMNIMLVSVTERTREIGIRMAVGARGHDILLQFLIEAVTLSSIGGILGILSGIGGAKLLTLIKHWPTLVSAESVIISFVFSAAVGIFFGFYPARKASKLDPIDALRYE
jgi:putative ABC transport system permease protein